MIKFLKRLLKEQTGQDLTEYALLLVLIALAAITSMKGLSTAIQTVFNSADTTMTGAAGGGGGGGCRGPFC